MVLDRQRGGYENGRVKIVLTFRRIRAVRFVSSFDIPFFGTVKDLKRAL